MLLTIDVGNTNMVFGIYENDLLRGSFRISTNAERTSDELGMMIAQYYQFLRIDLYETRDIIIASVVPPIMYTLINAVRKFIGVTPLIVGENVDTGIRNLYSNPKEVGIDRLVNAVSAIDRYGKSLIILDMGTATTFDAVDENGSYLGGAIFPGIKVAMEAMFMKAAKLPRVDIVMTENAIGKTTVESMQSGVMRGYIGAVEGIVRDMKKEMSGDIKVVATGGLARMVAEHSDIIDIVDAGLTLDGLKLIFDRYEENKID